MLHNKGFHENIFDVSRKAVLLVLTLFETVVHRFTIEWLFYMKNILKIASFTEPFCYCKGLHAKGFTCLSVYVHFVRLVHKGSKTFGRLFLKESLIKFFAIAKNCWNC